MTTARDQVASAPCLYAIFFIKSLSPTPWDKTSLLNARLLPVKLSSRSNTLFLLKHTSSKTLVKKECPFQISGHYEAHFIQCVHCSHSELTAPQRHILIVTYKVATVITKINHTQFVLPEELEDGGVGRVGQSSPPHASVLGLEEPLSARS